MALPQGTSAGLALGLDLFEGTAYRTIRRLRAGGMGEVFLVEHRTTGRRVVAKLIHAKLAADPALMERLRIEAQSAAQLDHEYVVKILAFEQTRTGRPFLVMEYLEGRTLAEELAARGPLPVLEAVSFACHLLSALTAVHEKGLVHRDIKPDNLFVCPGSDGAGCLKLLDFGVVRVMPGSHAVEPLPHDFRTRTGVVVGTPRFVSPEGAMGQPVDPRGDLYAAGLALYIMLVGRGPFDHFDGEQMLLTAHATEDPAAPSVLANEPVPPVLDRIVLKALAKQPLDRFQTADEFRAALESVADLLRRPSGWLHTTAFDVSRVAPKLERAQTSGASRGETAATPPGASELRESPSEDSPRVQALPAPISVTPGVSRTQVRVSPGVALAVVLTAIVVGLLASVGLVSILQRGP